MRGDLGAAGLRRHQLPEPRAPGAPASDVGDVPEGESAWPGGDRREPRGDGNSSARRVPLSYLLGEQGESQLGFGVGGEHAGVIVASTSDLSGTKRFVMLVGQLLTKMGRGAANWFGALRWVRRQRGAER